MSAEDLEMIDLLKELETLIRYHAYLNSPMYGDVCSKLSCWWCRYGS